MCVRMILSIGKGSNHCHTDGRNVLIARRTIFKNKLRLVIIYESILVSLWTFQLSFVLMHLRFYTSGVCVYLYISACICYTFPSSIFFSYMFVSSYTYVYMRLSFPFSPASHTTTHTYARTYMHIFACVCVWCRRRSENTGCRPHKANEETMYRWTWSHFSRHESTVQTKWRPLWSYVRAKVDAPSEECRRLASH